ncbi:hypothetical protein ACSBR1_022079 [Camellia fascicularis]
MNGLGWMALEQHEGGRKVSRERGTPSARNLGCATATTVSSEWKRRKFVCRKAIGVVLELWIRHKLAQCKWQTILEAPLILKQEWSTIYAVKVRHSIRIC